jgi:hypothetical protein
VRFREQATVEQAYRLEHERRIAARSAFVMARQQLLRHGVAIIVSQHVDLPDALLAQQRLVQVGLVENRVAVAPRLGGPAEADHVRRQHLGVIPAQLRP